VIDALEVKLARVYVAPFERVRDGKTQHVDGYWRNLEPGDQIIQVAPGPEMKMPEPPSDVIPLGVLMKAKSPEVLADVAKYGDVFASVDRSIALHRDLKIKEPWNEWEWPRRLAYLNRPREHPYDGIGYTRTDAVFDTFDESFQNEEDYGKGFYFREHPSTSTTFGKHQLKVQIHMKRPLDFGQPVPLTLLRDMETSLQSDPDYQAIPGDSLREKYDFWNHGNDIAFDELPTAQYGMAAFHRFVAEIGGSDAEDSGPVQRRFRAIGVDGMLLGKMPVVWDAAALQILERDGTPVANEPFPAALRKWIELQTPEKDFADLPVLDAGFDAHAAPSEGLVYRGFQTSSLQLAPGDEFNLDHVTSATTSQESAKLFSRKGKGGTHVITVFPAGTPIVDVSQQIDTGAYGNEQEALVRGNFTVDHTESVIDHGRDYQYVYLKKQEQFDKLQSKLTDLGITTRLVSSPYSHILVAEDKDGTQVGELVYSVYDDGVNIHSEHVDPKWRNKGVASGMFADLHDRFNKPIIHGSFASSAGISLGFYMASHYPAWNKVWLDIKSGQTSWWVPGTPVPVTAGTFNTFSENGGTTAIQQAIEKGLADLATEDSVSLARVYVPPYVREKGGNLENVDGYWREISLERGQMPKWSDLEQLKPWDMKSADLAKLGSFFEVEQDMGAATRGGSLVGYLRGHGADRRVAIMGPEWDRSDPESNKMLLAHELGHSIDGPMLTDPSVQEALKPFYVGTYNGMPVYEEGMYPGRKPDMFSRPPNEFTADRVADVLTGHERKDDEGNISAKFAPLYAAVRKHLAEVGILEAEDPAKSETPPVATSPNAWYQLLTEDEFKAGEFYKGTGYKSMNPALRGQKEMSPLMEKRTKLIDSALAKGALSKDQTLYRMAPAKAFGNLEVGTEFIDSAFISTSLKRNFAGDYRHQKQTQVFEIRAKAGQRGGFADQLWRTGKDHLYLNPNLKENEFILPRGTKFRVTRTWIDKSGVKHSELEVVNDGG